MKKVIVFLLLLMFTMSTSANARELKKHPGWAIVATAILPGGGQFYAENYARGIFFAILQISLTSMTVYEKIQAMDYQYLYNQNGNQESWIQYNKHKGRVKNLLWWDAGIWFLSCADAFTDAHFYEFNEDVGISMGLSKKTGIPQVEIKIKFK